MSSHFDLMQDLIGRAKKLGASDADVILVEGENTHVAVRGGKVEKLERSENKDLGIRVFVGKKQAVASASLSDLTDYDALVERAVAMAKLAPEDALCGLAEKDVAATGEYSFDNTDKTGLTAEQLQDNARAAEAAALSIKGVTQAEGADANAGKGSVSLVNSNGFMGRDIESSFSLSVSAIAGTGTEMERDYDFTAAVFAEDLLNPDAVGRKAGENAVRRLNPQKVKTQKVPVLFDPRTSNGLLRYFANAVNGAGIARGTSFLKNKMGQKIFSDSIAVLDDPFRLRGLRSRHFDAEGVPCERRVIVDKGVLQTWILDCRAARQLGLKTTGHASRGVGSVPSPVPSNLYIAPGSKTPQQLMADIKTGFYVTEVMGMGVNLITGDFSQGASGYWIENGEIAFPVSEVTVAGHLGDMFMEMTPANDLEFKYGIDAPTLRIEQMTLAGQ